MLCCVAAPGNKYKHPKQCFIPLPPLLADDSILGFSTKLLYKFNQEALDPSAKMVVAESRETSCFCKAGCLCHSCSVPCVTSPQAISKPTADIFNKPFLKAWRAQLRLRSAWDTLLLTVYPLNILLGHRHCPRHRGYKQIRAHFTGMTSKVERTGWSREKPNERKRDHFNHDF